MGPFGSTFGLFGSFLIIDSFFFWEISTLGISSTFLTIFSPLSSKETFHVPILSNPGPTNGFTKPGPTLGFSNPGPISGL